MDIDLFAVCSNIMELVGFSLKTLPIMTVIEMKSESGSASSNRNQGWLSVTNIKAVMSVGKKIRPVPDLSRKVSTYFPVLFRKLFLSL